MGGLLLCKAQGGCQEQVLDTVQGILLKQEIPLIYFLTFSTEDLFKMKLQKGPA